jgi:hypothetical protein
MGRTAVLRAQQEVATPVPHRCQVSVVAVRRAESAFVHPRNEAAARRVSSSRGFVLLALRTRRTSHSTNANFIGKRSGTVNRRREHASPDRFGVLRMTKSQRQDEGGGPACLTVQSDPAQVRATSRIYLGQGKFPVAAYRLAAGTPLDRA